MTKKTSLYNLHQKNGAKLVEFAGYEMPIQYKDGIIQEHKYTRSNCGIFDVSLHDIFLGFLAGFFQVGFGFIFITIGARTTPSAVVGIIMMSEAIFGPIWAWIFINEQPPFIVLIGAVSYTHLTLPTKRIE